MNVCIKRHIKRSETLQSDRYHRRKDYSVQEEVGVCEEGGACRESLENPDGRVSVPPQSRQVSGSSSRPREEISEFLRAFVIGIHFHVCLEISKSIWPTVL